MEIVPEYRVDLEAAGLATFDAMMRAPASGPPASRHALRETVPLELSINGQPRRFFLKRVFSIPPRHALLPLLRLRPGISQPRHEWTVLGLLKECGLPSMKRVAFGEERSPLGPRRAFLLVEAIPASRTIRDWLVPGFNNSEPLGPDARGELLEAVGGLIGRLHRHGFTWRDIHAKHIFADRESGSPGHRWRLWMIDVERMRRVGGSNAVPFTGVDKLTMADLVRFRESLLPLSLSRRDVLRFTRGYSRAMSPVSRLKVNDPFKFSRDDVRLFSDRMNPPRIPDDYTHPRALPTYVSNGIEASPAAHALLAETGFRSIDDVFKYSDGRSLSKPGLASHRDRIHMVLRDKLGNERVCYLKRYLRPPMSEQLRRMREHDRRDSSAKREAHFIKHLSAIGIPTMRKLAWGQEMSGPWERRSFIMTEELAGESLEKLAIRAGHDASHIPPPRERHEIIRQLAVLTRHMHARAYFHRDLYLCHVFITRNVDGGIVLQLIDLARMIHRPLLQQRWRIKDLAALDYSSPAPLVTRADRIRFLYHYQRAMLPRVHRTVHRGLIQEVRQRVRRMARHDASRHRRHHERPTA